jgi:hypothetical protein
MTRRDAAYAVREWWELNADDGAGSEVYNRVIVVASTPAGTPLRVERTAAQQVSPPLRGITTPSLANPSFDVDASGWTSITRDTTTFESSPASGIVGGTSASATFSGTFKAGLAYVIQFAVKGSVAAVTSAIFGDNTTVNGDRATATIAFTTGWTVVSLTWMPSKDVSNASISLVNPGPGPTLNVDSFKLFRAVPTIVDRQGFRRTMRLPISAALPADGVVAAALGDVWLSDHKLIPFKGTVTVKEGDVREVLTGATVPLELLPIRTMELLRFNDRNDPDTGGQGRDGRIVAAKWTHATDSCEITIDNSREYFTSLLARLSAFTGS